ncbi:hypothetical protein [Streptomyces prunicolor]|uniref:hypothetical protein n=1 Tax=Streptomyces prunicolor TaxID=67348 RepID=UPI0034116674
MAGEASQRRHVDRAEQLESAALVIARDTERQALFFEGPEGIGKSSLLVEIYERQAAEGVYFVDLARMAAQADVLNELARQARRQGVQVPSYQSTRTRLAESAQVTFDHVRARSTTINVVLAAAADRSIQLASLSDALLDNLVSGARSPVICLDGFEACAAPMRDWLGRDLLPDLLAQPHVSVFVAGRQVPRLSHPHVSSVHTMALPPLDVNAVQEWIETLGFSSLKDEAAAIHETHGGIPGLIDSFLALHLEPHQHTLRSDPENPDTGSDPHSRDG